MLMVSFKKQPERDIEMKVRLSLKNWKINNTKAAWDKVIFFVPPYYRAGVSHENLSTRFRNGGSFDIDFGNSIDVAEKFMSDMVITGANLFDIGTTD